MAEEVAHLTHEQLRAHIAQYKDTYDKTRKYALQLTQKHQRSVTREKRILVDHQKQILQAETLNMMTKYQLVFAKIECQVNRVLNSNKIRELGLVQRAFDKFRRNTQAARLQTSYNTHLINLRLRSNLGVRILARFQTSRLRALRKAFESWRLTADAAKVVERLQHAIKQELDSTSTTRQKLVQALQTKQAELKRELAKQQDLQKRHESIRSLIVDAEEKLAEE